MHAVQLMSIGRQQLHGHMCGCTALNTDGVRSWVLVPTWSLNWEQPLHPSWDQWDEMHGIPIWAYDLGWVFTGVLQFGRFWRQWSRCRGLTFPPAESELELSNKQSLCLSDWRAFPTFYRKQTVRLFLTFFFCSAPRIHFEIKIQLGFNTFSCCLIFELLHVCHPQPFQLK